MHADLTLGQVTRPTGFAETLVLAAASRLVGGELTIRMPNGAEYVFEGAGPGPKAHINVKAPRMFRRLVSGGDLGLAESYIDGDWDTPDLAALIELGALNEARVLDVVDERPWRTLARRMLHALRPNSKRGAQRNIAAHYDLGNEFYAEWLDRTRSYSAALFESPDDDLATAQDRKYGRMASLADIAPHHRVLDIGCGWGGFCTWAARNIGCHVTAITISRAQYDHTRQIVRDEGLQHCVEVRLQDYRDLTDSFDRIVSIEMLEAVGEAYWPEYFRQLRARLRPGGHAALQVITIDDGQFDRYRRAVDFIQRYIFPGGMLPSPSVLRRLTADAGLTWAGAWEHGQDYARTLAIWHRRFDEVWPRIKALRTGARFDERFRRMWKYYLAYCEAGFRVRRIDVLQIALSCDSNSPHG